MIDSMVPTNTLHNGFCPVVLESRIFQLKRELIEQVKHFGMLIVILNELLMYRPLHRHSNNHLIKIAPDLYNAIPVFMMCLQIPGSPLGFAGPR